MKKTEKLIIGLIIFVLGYSVGYFVDTYKKKVDAERDASEFVQMCLEENGELYVWTYNFEGGFNTHKTLGCKTETRQYNNQLQPLPINL